MSSFESLLVRTRAWSDGLNELSRSGAVLTRHTVTVTLLVTGGLTFCTGVVASLVPAGTQARSLAFPLVGVPLSMAVLFLMRRIPSNWLPVFWRLNAVLLFVLIAGPSLVNGSVALVLAVAVFPLFWLMVPPGEALRFAVTAQAGQLLGLWFTTAPVDPQIVIRTVAANAIVSALVHSVFRHLGSILNGAAVLATNVQETVSQVDQDLHAIETARLEEVRLDSITGLLSLEGLQQQISNVDGPALVLSIRLTGWEAGVLALSLGLQQEALRVISGRLQSLVGPEAPTARVDRSEFVVVWTGIHREVEGTRQRVEQLHQALANPVFIDGRSILPQPEIGIAERPVDCVSFEDCLRRARLARVVAEQMHVNAPSYFDETMERQAQDRAVEVARLRVALEKEEFELHYQPIVPTVGGRTVSAEALVRWRDGARGLVSPGLFLPLMASANLLRELTLWVLRQAVEDVRRFRAEIDPAFGVSVNIPPDLLATLNPTKALQFYEALAVPRNALTLEVTESCFVELSEPVRRVVGVLREQGVRVAMDDFGTGYSSLDRLETFPLDILKIDRAFVSRLTDASPRTIGVMKAVIDLGHILGLDMVAEGVETEAQRQLLASLGCPKIQGFLISRPVPADDLVRFATAP